LARSSAAVSDYDSVSMYPINVTNEPHHKTSRPAAITVGTAANIPPAATIAPAPAAEHMRFNPVACFVVIVSFSFTSRKATLVPNDKRRTGLGKTPHIGRLAWTRREISRVDYAKFSAL
jgi:hypothetical protein